jgi:BA14K-like protein
MLGLKHIGAAAIAAVIATAMVIDTADARRGGGGAGAGARAGGVGGGARVANAGALARVSHPITGRPGIGRFGRVGRGWGWGWVGGGWGTAALGAAAVGTGLAYASSSYCDPYYAPCNGPYASYGSYAYAPPTYGANYGSIVPASPSYGSYANGTFGSLGVSRPTTYEFTYAAAPDAIADCARRFRSYDPASQTYLSYSGQRVPCP